MVSLVFTFCKDEVIPLEVRQLLATLLSFLNNQRQERWKNNSYGIPAWDGGWKLEDVTHLFNSRAYEHMELRQIWNLSFKLMGIKEILDEIFENHSELLGWLKEVSVETDEMFVKDGMFFWGNSETGQWPCPEHYRSRDGKAVRLSISVYGVQDDAKALAYRIALLENANIRFMQLAGVHKMARQAKALLKQGGDALNGVERKLQKMMELSGFYGDNYDGFATNYEDSTYGE